ncbi:MAG: tetratricopeptide repeat protein [Acidobacteria bacterium]|nr:tetratricopeptide repeat protein [Acidobacteriota bacterium]
MCSRIGVSTTLHYLCVMFAAASLSTAAGQQSGLADPPAVPESEPSDGESIPGLAAAVAALAAEEEVLEAPGPEIEAYVTRLEAQLTLRDRLDHGEYTEAVPVAARLVELTSEEFGERSTETAVAISNLAESQRRARLYEDAEQNFLSSVDLFRQLGG